jgi:UDP-N-acetylglucosamine--N-acetylmuramyl-(pentapeptide) pyrophosphoryl-undecaprenol N-acetylglucosamine transferase
VPSIIIPITNSNGNHQRENAYAYARTGACEVIEENNLTSHLLSQEIDRIISNKDVNTKMKDSTAQFVEKESARKIATEILNITLSHQK